jgi:hypothetical protein
VTFAVSLGMPSMEPDVWRKDVRRAKDAITAGQLLVVSVAGTLPPGGDHEALIADYARCAVWAAEAGADVIEVHLGVADPFSEHAQMIFENVPLSAQILYRVRTSIGQPVVAKLGMFRSPRLLHETATKLAPWTNGFVLVHGALRRVVDEEGKTAFEGVGRDLADIVGADTFALAARQVARRVPGIARCSRSAASRPPSAGSTCCTRAPTSRSSGRPRSRIRCSASGFAKRSPPGWRRRRATAAGPGRHPAHRRARRPAKRSGRRHAPRRAVARSTPSGSARLARPRRVLG